MQEGPHGAGPDPALVTKPAQLTVDATVAPGRVLPGQPQHKRPKLGHHSRATPLVRLAPAASDKVSMPAQQRFGPDEQPAPGRSG
jgi:hypothetical protein